MYVLTLLSKGVPTIILKFFWLKIFLICHRCQRHRWSMFSCEYLREFSKKFETVLIGYSGAGGKLIDEKNQKQKISWHCPFKLYDASKEMGKRCTVQWCTWLKAIYVFYRTENPARGSFRHLGNMTWEDILYTSIYCIYCTIGVCSF